MVRVRSVLLLVRVRVPVPAFWFGSGSPSCVWFGSGSPSCFWFGSGSPSFILVRVRVPSPASWFGVGSPSCFWFGSGSGPPSGFRVTGPSCFVFPGLASPGSQLAHLCLSASASLVSLAWIIASYQKTLRDSRDDKLPMSYKAVIVQMLWHFFTIGARTIAFALFASVFQLLFFLFLNVDVSVLQLYFGIFVVSHWCLMTFWIIQGETDFCMSKWEEIIYNMVVGIVYIFCWFNVKEGRARFRMWLYHTVTLVENVSLIAAWYLYRGPNTSDFYALVVVCVVVCSYALGIFFMLGYYCLLHPDGPVSAAQWGGCVEDGGLMVESCVTPAEASPLPPPDVVTSPPRTLTRTAGADRGEVVPGDLAVFQVRSTATTSPALAPRPLRTEGPVIRIDLPRKRYPAWDAHFIDRRLRKTILVLENTSPVTPRIQYRSLSKPKEVMEYETTV
nr:XK-related protein 7-like [Oncorhynchus nerka]